MPWSHRNVGTLTAAIVVLASACSGSSGTKPGVDVITTVAGAGIGPAFAASGLATGRAGELFVSDRDGNRVVKVDDGGHLTAVAGRGTAGFSGDGGQADKAQLSSPGALATDGAGNLFIADDGNNRVRKVEPNGRISTVAGNSFAGFVGDGGAASDTPLGGPNALAVDGSGDVFIAETSTGRVRRVDRSGTINTVAGGGSDVPTGAPGEATRVDLGGLTSIVVNRAGDLVVTFSSADRVVRVTPDGSVSVVAGTPFDGNAEHPVVTALDSPGGVAVDRHGAIIVAEAGNANRVRRIDASGVVSTLAEGGPQPDHDRAARPKRDVVLFAALSGPDIVAVSRAGNVFVSDTGNLRVRELSGRAAQGYTTRPAYTPRPFVEKLRPTEGGAAGGTAVVVSGRGFVDGKTSVRFGSRPGKVVDVFGDDNGGTLMALAPPQPAGTTVDVVVTTPGGSSRATPSTRYTYVTGWEFAAPLATARFTHAAMLLDPPACHASTAPAGYPCGRVLVAGGNEGFCISCNPFDSAELYDPATNVWRAAAKMNHPRMNHTATLLPDGRVLVVGGKQGDAGTDLRGHTALTSAELYDPSTDSWADTSALGEARFDHTATLLDGAPCRAAGRPPWCGRVLVAGGATRELGREPVASAELWDPATGTWTGAGELSFARQNHTASLLPDGRVLVAGGLGAPRGAQRENDNTNYVFASSEIYDPSAGSWSRGPDMSFGRAAHTATALANGQVLVVGGAIGTEFIKSAEIFDPGTARWRATDVPISPHGTHVAALLPDGRVLVAGGGPTFEDPITRADSIASAEVYDPGTDRWSATRVLNVARTFATATVLDGPACRAGTKPSYCGAVLVVGGGGTNDDPAGKDSPIPQSSTELYR